MRYLVDSHALIRFVDQDHLLGAAAHSAMSEPSNELLVSAATVWEIAIKVGLGKLKLAMAYREWMDRAIGDLDLAIMPITVAVADVQANLPWHHRDPFDRLIVAQAMVEQVPVISADSAFDRYPVERVW